MVGDETDCTFTSSGDVTGVTPGSTLTDTTPQEHGGPTGTLALAAGSPALGNGLSSVCRDTTVNGVDQRGLARPSSGGCDSGAYQHGPYLSSLSPDTVQAGSSAADLPITLSGHDFDTTSPVEIDLNGLSIGTASASSDGTSVSATIPAADLSAPHAGADGDQPTRYQRGGDLQRPDVATSRPARVAA